MVAPATFYFTMVVNLVEPNAKGVFVIYLSEQVKFKKNNKRKLIRYKN